MPHAPAQAQTCPTPVVANGFACTVPAGTTINVAPASAIGLRAIGAAGSITANGVTLNFTANGNRGAQAEGGGQITFNNSTLTGGTLNQRGFYALNAGSSIFAANSSIALTGNNSPGIWADAGSIFLNNVTISTAGGSSSAGLLVFRATGHGDVNGGSIITTGNGPSANAIAARDQGATLTVTGARLETSGTTAMGVVSDDGATVQLSASSVVTRGFNAIGLFSVVELAATQFARLSGVNLTVETFGDKAYGALAQQNNLTGPAVINLDSSSVTTRGTGSTGLLATTGGKVNASQTSVIAEGAAANGLWAKGSGSSVNLLNSSVSTSGFASHAAVAEAGGLITATGATLSVQGDGAMALYIAGDTGRASSAQLTGSTLTTASGPAVGVAGLGNVLLTNSTVRGAGEWLRVGTINDFAALTLPEASYAGVVHPDGIDPPGTLFAAPAPLASTPAVANIVLSGSNVTGSVFTAPGSISNLELRDNSTWTMTGNSSVTNLLNDPSLIQFTPPSGDPTLLSSYKTLTVMNYIGEGGIVGLNTYLGSDGSPSDRLIINGGGATGASLLSIAKTGGNGAVTAGNGILVVDALNGGSTQSGAFSLTTPVLAGPYQYSLFRGSRDASNPNAWFLRSTIDCAAPGAPSPPCGTSGGISPGPSPGPSPNPPQPTPPASIPNFRAEVSMYAAVPAMTLLYGRNLIDSLHQRVGDESDQRGKTGANLGWGRLIGMTGHRDSRDTIFGAGPSYGYEFLGVQAGHDLYRTERANGSRDQAGLYFAAGTARGDVTHFDRLRGNSNFDGYSLGGYWTHFGPGGWYVDAVLQGTWHTVTSHARRFLRPLETSGASVGGSLEVGYPFRLPSGFFIEPQAQVVYQRVFLDDAADSFADVRFRDVESMAGRIGARFGRTWALDGQRTMTAWLRPNIWHEFRGNPLTEFSSATGFIPFRANLGGTWGELNGGISGQITPATTVYANAAYQSRFEGKSFAYTGQVGLRVNW